MTEKIYKHKNKIIYYSLKTDSIQSEEFPKEFNLETKKFNKERDIFDIKSKKIKIFEEYFNCKLKKIKKRNKNKPTPYQKFLKEKEYLKSMNNLRIQQNINLTKQNINLITTIDKNKQFSSDKKNNNNKFDNLGLKKISSSIYINKIKNYKEKNYFFDKTKKRLYNNYIKEDITKEDFKIHKSKKSLDYFKNMKLLYLISSNNTINTNEVSLKENNNSNFKTKKSNKKNNFTNTFHNIKSNKNEKFISYRNLNGGDYFPKIFNKYNNTEDSITKNKAHILNIFSYENKINVYNHKNQNNLKSKKDIDDNKKLFGSKNNENESKIIKPRNTIKFFINEKII